MTIQPPVPVKILILSDDKSRIKTVKMALENELFSEILTTSLDTAFNDIVASDCPVLFLIETANLKSAYFELLTKVQNRCEPSKISVIAVFPSAELPLYVPFFKNAFLDFMVLPVLPEDMMARLNFARQRLQREEQFSRMGQLDALTGVLTRNGFIEQATALYASAKRNQISVAILMLSVDRLNGINLRFGQSISDKVLIGFADILSNRKRDTDLLCRYSDNSFCLMTVNMRLSHFDTFLDDIVLLCLSPQYKAGLVTLDINASLGLTSNLGRDLDHMLSKAQSALEQSRKRGPNEVTINNDIISEPVPFRSNMS